MVDRALRRLRHVHAGGSAGELGATAGLEQIGFWRKILEHPSYDAFWRDQAVDKVLANAAAQVPVMLVHSLWDQEDIYGAIAVYKAIEPKDTQNDKVFLVIGPWHHGQEIDDGSSLGAIKFDSDTALEFRRQILRPFLDHYLKDDAPARRRRAGVGVRDRHEQLAAAERVADRVCQRVHHRADAALPAIRLCPRIQRARVGGDAAFDEYVSDPEQAGAVPGTSHAVSRV